MPVGVYAVGVVMTYNRLKTVFSIPLNALVPVGIYALGMAMTYNTRAILPSPLRGQPKGCSNLFLTNLSFMPCGYMGNPCSRVMG